MKKINDQEITNITNNNEKNDSISKLVENEQEFISLIKQIIDSEFDELFKKILNLPKIDFLNQITSNVSFVLSDQFTPKIFENDKCVSIITSTLKDFDKIYNKYMEELSEGWDQYNFENINQIQNYEEEKLESYYLKKFTKHCHKTQEYALHQCNTNGEVGKFIIVYDNSDCKPNSHFQKYKKNSNKKIKYLICQNCRESYFSNEFQNFCQNCNTIYLCCVKINDEDDNFLPATLNPPHCESFVNEELLCQKCQNVLYIDIKNNNLKCGNKRCNYCVSIENNNKISFTCKICNNIFKSNVKIFNQVEVLHFKKIINKALLYKKKAYPGKLSCCTEIKEKRTDFYHKKDCRGKLYFIEYNQKIIIICSKCKAVNQYSKYIWICPECGLHFRDKKSEENELKIRKTKSSNRLVKSKRLFPDLDDSNKLNLNNNKQSLADLLRRRKSLYENKSLYSNYFNYENYNTERKKLSLESNEQKLYETDEHIDRTNTSKECSQRKKGKYLFNKILPWISGRTISVDNTDKNSMNRKKYLYNKNKDKKEYYDQKVNEIINPKQIRSEFNLKSNENENTINICQSGRVHYKFYVNNDSNTIFNNDNDNEINRKLKGRKKYRKELNSASNNFNLSSSKVAVNNSSSIESNNAFNKIKSPDNKYDQKTNDLKCKKFVPIKLKYLKKKEAEKEDENNKENMNENISINNNNKGKKRIFCLYSSQRIKKHNELEINSNIKKDISNQNNSIENMLTNNKESWKSKETTSKGSIESRNSNFSHSPIKENEEENRKNNKIYINIDDNSFSENDEIEEEEKEDEEDDIIPPEKINYEEENYIEDNKIKEDKNLYDHIQRRLKKILVKGRLPRFNLDKYTIEKQIGDGSFGIIYSVYNNTSKRKYAMKKIIANNINSLEAFQKEFEISYHDKHPSIIDIKGVCIKCYDQTTYVLYVLMDLADNDWEMEINDREKNKDYYQEKDLISILKQLSSALYFLQKEKKIAHRDIKCENVLIFKNKTPNKNKFGEYLYKICDFGEAKDYAISLSSKNKTIRGTELYMSPLLYNGLLHDESYVEHNAYKSDVFSLGCCMIIAAVLDFDIINEIRELKEQIKIERFLKKKLLPRYSEKFIDILLKMINFNEKERFDFIQLEEIIETTL